MAQTLLGSALEVLNELIKISKSLFIVLVIDFSFAVIEII